LSQFQNPSGTNRQDAKDAKKEREKTLFSAFSWRPWRLGGFETVSYRPVGTGAGVGAGGPPGGGVLAVPGLLAGAGAGCTPVMTGAVTVTVD
jgi:hypothetical protein